MVEAVEQSPREVVLAAGHWIGQQFREDGFEWLPSRMTLQRPVGTLRHQIHLQPSRYNRRGGSIKVQTLLNVRDAALRRWGRTNPDRVVRPGDYVCGHPLGYASGRANAAAARRAEADALKQQCLAEVASGMAARVAEIAKRTAHGDEDGAGA
jgi:hypothetical protein